MNRINPDSRAVLVLTVVVTIVLGCVSFLLSYSGLVAVAAWAAVPAWLAWAVPVTVDGAILVYTLAALVFRARGESARAAWASLALFTGLSVASNAMHAWDSGVGDGRAVIGTLIAGLAPVAVLLTTHTLARLIVAPVAPVTVAEVAPAPAGELAPAPPRKLQGGSSRDVEIHRLAREERLTGREIAERVGVSPSTVSRVLDRPAPVVGLAA